jgi:hypothetical protein
MNAFLRLLYAESAWTGKPIVYLAHPVEFLSSGKRRFYLKGKTLSLSYIRTHGLLLRRALYGMDGQTWFRATRELFAHIASLPGVAFMTSNEYVSQLNHAAETGGCFD